MRSTSSRVAAPTVICGSVVEQDTQLLDIVDCFATQQRVGAAGVVSDHAANGAAIMSGRVGCERQLMSFSLIAEGIEDNAGLHPGESLLRVELEDPVHVLGEIEHHGDIAALAGQAGACSARQDWGSVFAAGRHGSHHVGSIAGHH